MASLPLSPPRFLLLLMRLNNAKRCEIQGKANRKEKRDKHNIIHIQKQSETEAVAAEEGGNLETIDNFVPFDGEKIGAPGKNWGRIRDRG